MSQPKPRVLITGASSGIGAAYADRFARRGHDLVLVARDASRLRELADKLKQQSGVNAAVVRADLCNPSDLAAVERLITEEHRIGIVVNNAGAAHGGPFTSQRLDQLTSVIDLNVTAAARIASAAARRFEAEAEGAIINIASVIAFAPELSMTLYGATKAFLLFLSRGLDIELGPKGVYVQAVLPAATRTEIWERGGVDPDTIPNMMDVGDLVDAALVGFDRRESVTIPPLPDEAQWTQLEDARKAMLPNLRQPRPAERYLKAA